MTRPPPRVSGWGTGPGPRAKAGPGMSLTQKMKFKKKRLEKEKLKEERLKEERLKRELDAKKETRRRKQAYTGMGAATAAMGYYGKVQYENIKDILEETKELDDNRKRRIHERARAKLPKKRPTKKAQGGLVTNFKGTF